MEAKLSEITLYVAKWLQFQSLWDLEADYVYAQLGDSLSSWQQLLLEIRKTRSTFDNSDIQRSFGVAIINYQQVQTKVNAKYDTWQKDILGRFGVKLGVAIKDTHSTILKARHDLEHHSIEGSSTSATVSFITFVTDLNKRATRKWTPEMETFNQGQITLERQRYQFASDWLQIDRLEGEWTAFKDILARKTASIQEQLGSSSSSVPRRFSDFSLLFSNAALFDTPGGLQLKIIAEDKVVQQRVRELIVDWEANKPIEGSLASEVAMASIMGFELRLSKLTEAIDGVSRAKEALDLEVVSDLRLDPVLEELSDLKSVWTALSAIWSQIDELRDALWSTVQSRKLRQHLDTLLNSTREMPSRMRQYAAFEYVQEVLRSFIKSNTLIADLKSEALRERHWRSLFKALKVSMTYSPTTMTLNSVWNLDLKKNESIIEEVILQAQGEMALEEYLKLVRFNPLKSQSYLVLFFLCAFADLSGIFFFSLADQGNLEQLRSRSRQLPEQDSLDSRMGRPLHQMQRESQLVDGNEAISVLQGI